ncbi:MAG: pteridine-dependent deoxygenase [Pseudoxanthomonas sp.]
MNHRPRAALADSPTFAPRLAVEYADPGTLDAALAQPDTLAVFAFGDAAPHRADPRWLRVPLSPLGTPMLEIWRAAGPVTHGITDGIAHAEDDALQFGALQLQGNDAADMLAASERAYAQAAAFRQRSGHPRLLRIWNYFDRITEGEGDDERYRQFCVGRVRGLGAVDATALPAATAIGTRGGTHVLQVYWLAARQPGTPLENPRQTSAWRYPRQYGPQSPSFARALLPPSPAVPLLVSGTASIVGHASRHAGSLDAQMDETLANLDHLLAAARERQPCLPPQWDASTRLKAYLPDPAHAARVQTRLRERLGRDVPLLLLHGDVCRRELQVEIEAMHGVLPAAS